MRHAALSCWQKLRERLTRVDPRWSMSAIFVNLSCC